MIRIVLVLGACAWLLAGCSAATRQASFPTRYALTPAHRQPALGAPAVHVHPATLRLTRIPTPTWLQGTAMVYRLAYRNPDALAAYADSEWASPPAGMLALRIRSALARGSAWRVVGPRIAARSDATLSIQLEDFSQVFAHPRQSQGVLRATATLVANPGGQLIAQRQFDVEAPAPTADAAGGVRALSAASDRFIGQLRRWLATHATERLKPPPSARATSKP